MTLVKVDTDKFLADIAKIKIPNQIKSSFPRSSYSGSGHSSVNQAATSFGQPKPDIRDAAEAVDGEIPHNKQFAPTADGAGDKAQQEGNIATFDKNGSVGPLDPAAWDKYKQQLGTWESNNNYGSVNTIGFSGRHQFGAAALIDLGYVKNGTATRALGRNDAWTGKDGINSREAFLGNKDVQDQAILTYTKSNYKSLVRMGVVSTSSPVDEVGGYLAAAHLKGPGGARKLKNGQDNKDAYGTSASKYYKGMKAALNGSSPIDGKTPEEYVNSTTQPDSAGFAMPSSPAAPQYPHNKITEYEGGHFKEYDSTPGNERIQERHKSGTGYEVISDGTQRNIVVGDNYTAVMGSDFIMINGSCQVIVNGDCGLSVNGSLNHSISNDYNLNVGGKFNIAVGSDKYENISGNSALSISGDSAVNISGFLKLGVDGDIFSESASYSHVSKDGNINLGATKSINIAATDDINVVSSSNTNIAAKADVVTSAGGSMTSTAAGDATFASTGGNTNLHASGTLSVHADGSVKLEGSSVHATPMIDRAQYAMETGIASAMGATVQPPAQGSNGAGSSGESQETAQNNTEESRIKNALELFTAFDSGKTQGHGGGLGELHGYSSGFNYDASQV